MNEEDIKIIEKKVNLLYKLLINLDVDQFSNINTKKVITDSMDDLKPLFDLSAENVMIKSRSKEEIEREKKELDNELKELEKKYQSGDYLAKEENQIKFNIKELKAKLEELTRITKNRKEIEGINNEIYEALLYQDLRRKVGIQSTTDKYLRINRDVGRLIDLDNLKKETLKGGVELTFRDMDGDFI